MAKTNNEKNDNQKFGPVPHQKASTAQNKELERLERDSRHIDKKGC